MGNPVVHFEIIGQDAAKLHSFYRDLFGWEIDANNEFNYGIVPAPEGQGIGGGIGADPSGNARVTVYAQVPDLQAALDKAVSLGGTTIMEPTDMGVVQIAMFIDPAGNSFGLLKG
jgi:predicted enzyme related to lactoylglutathione lyase